MKKALITGVSGFAGSFLAEHIFSREEYTIAGTYLTEKSLENITPFASKLELHKVDLQNSEATTNLIAKVSPDVVFHLAALASAAESFNNPAAFIHNNLSAQINILEGIRQAKLSPRILIVSSAEVYGNVSKKDLPINEKVPFAPVNPYAVSKVSQDALAQQYYFSYKLPIIRIRPFNHIGPRQAPAFAVASFAKKIAEIEAGKMSRVLKVGNLSAKRDFTDVRDIVRGYLLLLEKGRPGEVYNIGSGKSYEMSWILNKLLSFSKENIKVETDEALLRPVDVPELICDNSKIKNETGWVPQVPIEKTLEDTLDYWRSII
jgi:GDP-4-dehydro-6-deoxy-D-mannose reductase